MQVQHCFNILNGLCNRKFNVPVYSKPSASWPRNINPKKFSELVYKLTVKNEACKTENVEDLMRSHTSEGQPAICPLFFSFNLLNE